MVAVQLVILTNLKTEHIKQRMVSAQKEKVEVREEGLSNLRVSGGMYMGELTGISSPICLASPSPQKK